MSPLCGDSISGRASARLHLFMSAKVYYGDYPMNYGLPHMTRSMFHAFRNTHLFFLAFAVMFLPGCMTTKKVKAVGLHEDPIAYLRIMEISSQLLPDMDVFDKEKYRFLVLDDETPNAHAAPGHTIIVNKGLLDLFDNSELTCILAHEIAHVSLGHNARRASVYNSRDRVFIELKRMSPDTSLLNTMIKPLALKAYSKEQEKEADSEAVRAIGILGLSPEVYVTVLKKLAEHSDKNNAGKGGRLLDDHPSIDSRIEEIQKMNFPRD